MAHYFASTQFDQKKHLKTLIIGDPQQFDISLVLQRQRNLANEPFYTCSNSLVRHSICKFLIEQVICLTLIVGLFVHLSDTFFVQSFDKRIETLHCQTFETKICIAGQIGQDSTMFRQTELLTLLSYNKASDLSDGLI